MFIGFGRSRIFGFGSDRIKKKNRGVMRLNRLPWRSPSKKDNLSAGLKNELRGSTKNRLIGNCSLLFLRKKPQSSVPCGFSSNIKFVNQATSCFLWHEALRVCQRRLQIQRRVRKTKLCMLVQPCWKLPVLWHKGL